MEVDYDLDDDQLAHAGKKRPYHLTYVETHEAKRAEVKDAVARKVGRIKQEEEDIAEAEVDTVHAEYQEKLVKPMAKFQELHEVHCMYCSVLMLDSVAEWHFSLFSLYIADKR